ncbi:MAG TPA: hypothetical protein VID26_03600 [Candidatus Limnocylindrales bacterium]
MSRASASRRVARRRPAPAPESAEAGRFMRGLTIGLIVGAVIAGSTLWRRFGPLKTRP